MLRLLLALLIALALPMTTTLIPAQAQESTPPPTAPDYQIIVLTPPHLEGDEIEVEFGIYNQGGAAEQEATVVLTLATTGEQLGIQSIPALEARGGTASVTFRFPATNFTPGTVQSIQASVGIDEVEARNASTIGNNTTRVGFTAPQVTSVARPTEAAAGEAGTEATETPGGGAGLPRFNLPLVGEVNLNNPLHVGILLGVLGVALVLLWVATIILRLLFPRKTPQLGAWQPPYAAMSMLDPNSAAGRRQLWQPHAQSDQLMGPCAEGNYHIRKLLMGTDGATLSGWRVSAMRLSQYDMYGRVARSQAIAGNGVVKRLDRAAHKGHAMDETKAMQAARPIAQSLVRQFFKKLNPRNAMLPVSLDVRFRGTHGEVRILFELFGCNRGSWQLIDQWEPDMIVMQNAIQENFTYTSFGMNPGEDMKAFRARLQDELTQHLAEMITRQRTPPPAPITGEVEMPPIERYIPQDTSPHPPLGH